MWNTQERFGITIEQNLVKSKFLDFENFVVSFGPPCPSCPLLSSDDCGTTVREAVREAHGRGVQNTFLHAQQCPRCPTTAQEQVWENQKITISKIW